ncbi:sulfurtransferase [Cytobacillus sp. Hz8]|uniref:sulfurtransferase n=1 Tax=Cytobacillus sp. Hz8 TaxID=3347168 RepID=UPI0035DD0AEB
MDFFVNCTWLKDQLHHDKIRIVDCRFQMGQPEAGKNAYLEEHIPGAVYFDLEKDLSSAVQTHGGRHPLPNLDSFKALLDDSGIDEETMVIAYDAGGEAYATRLWWLLNYVGHKKVAILDGGFHAWKQANLPVTHEVPSYRKTNLDIQLQEKMLADYEDIKKIATDSNSKVILVDSRERNRYLGLAEPIDKKAGHIPGAINKVWTEGFRDGLFKGVQEQKHRFQDLSSESPVIVYCGSGVTATPNFLALKAAGFSNVKLYCGSFSDWISYDDNDVATGE